MTNLPKIIAGESFGISIGSQSDLDRWAVKITLFTSGTSKFSASSPATPHDDFTIARGSSSLTVNVPPLLSSSLNYDTLTMQLSLTDVATGATKIANAPIARMVSPRTIRERATDEIFREIVFVDNELSVTLEIADRIGIDGEKGDKGDKGERGEAAPFTLIEYSADGTGWHAECGDGDVFMRQSTDNGLTWSKALVFRQDISGKIDKDGYAPQARVGFADTLAAIDSSVAESTAEMGGLRVTGNGLSVQTGQARLKSVSGNLIKQYIGNGNFADGFKGWNTTGTQTGKGSHVAFETNNNTTLHAPEIYLAGGHKCVFMALVKSNSRAFYGCFGNTIVERFWSTANRWSWCGSFFNRDTGASTIPHLYIQALTDGHYRYEVAKEGGIMCFDLTELGLDTRLTTVQQCIDYFGTKYIAEGINASRPTAIVSTSFNQFDKRTMVLSGKSINASTGAIEEGPNYVIWAPCVRGINGENNGYRVADITGADNVVRVGYNPFAPTDGCFDTVYDMAAGASGRADILPVQAGWVIAEVKSLENICVHLKWSYADFSTQYNNGIEYRKESLGLSDISPLRGLRHHYSPHPYKGDSLDFENGIKSTSVVEVSFDGSEPWKVASFISNAFELPYNEVPSLYKVLEHTDRNYSLYNHYIAYLGAWAEMPDKFAQIYQPSEIFVVKDSAHTTLNAWKQHLAGLAAAGSPLTAYVALTSPQEEPMDKDINDLYFANDFGTEGVASDTHIPITADVVYSFNATDTIRHLHKRVATNELALSRLYGTLGIYYGIEWDTAVADTACTRTGNMALHRALPIQSRMRGCLLDDNGHVVEYLDADDWRGAVRDGSKGQVMVEIPAHWRKFETEGTKRRCLLSEYAQEGFHHVPKMYISAYEASVDRTDLKLASVVNTTARYRGGNNHSAWDGTYRTLLGRPATALTRTNFRNYARKRKPETAEWNCQDYNAYKALFWLYHVEYADRNSQLAFDPRPTSEGFKQGGLGNGVTTVTSTAWNEYNSYLPFVPCGHTDELGNGSGEVAYKALKEDGSVWVTVYANRYRGVENPFGHIWKWTDGINIKAGPAAGNGGDTSTVYVADTPADYKDTGYDGYSMRGSAPRTVGYVRQLVFGENGDIMPAVVGGDSTTYWADYHYTNIPTAETLRGVMFGGDGYDNAGAGFGCAHTQHAPSHSYARIGSRLCFIPEKTEF